MRKLHDKIYVISGASSGIGYAISESILENGGKILITGKSKKN